MNYTVGKINSDINTTYFSIIKVHNNKKLKTKLVPNLQEPPKIQNISMNQNIPDSGNKEQVSVMIYDSIQRENELYFSNFY